MVASRARADPLHGNTAEALLDELDVLFRVLGEVLVLGGAHGVALPAGEGGVLDSDRVENVGVGRVRGIETGAVGEDVSDADLDLVEVVQDIELGQIEGGVVVDGGGVAAEDEIEPAAATAAAGGDAEFLAG